MRRLALVLLFVLAAAGRTAAPLRAGGDVLKPVLVRHVEPKYTERARRGRVQGVVVIEAIIGTDGRVYEPKVLKSLPLGLDQAALDAVGHYEFKPAMLKGKPVEVYWTMTVKFVLPKEKS